MSVTESRVFHFNEPRWLVFTCDLGHIALPFVSAHQEIQVLSWQPFKRAHDAVITLQHGNKLGFNSSFNFAGIHRNSRTGLARNIAQ